MTGISFGVCHFRSTIDSYWLSSWYAVSDNRGGVLHADLREDKMKGKRWKLSESKIGCISVNPANQHYFVTSQLNREIRLWDARMVSRLESVTDYDTAFEQACVANYDTGRACSSTYFDPSGKHMLSTSYDDAIRGEKSAGRWDGAWTLTAAQQSGTWTLAISLLKD